MSRDADRQDPAQYLISTDGLRSHKAYYNPEVYGTITGEGFKGAVAPMKDGGMDWGKNEKAGKAEVKKPDKIEKKATKDTKETPSAKDPKEKETKETKEAQEVKVDPKKAEVKADSAGTKEVSRRGFSN